MNSARPLSGAKRRGFGSPPRLSPLFVAQRKAVCYKNSRNANWKPDASAREHGAKGVSPSVTRRASWVTARDEKSFSQFSVASCSIRSFCKGSARQRPALVRRAVRTTMGEP
jgi:hypothetical protein